MTPEDQTPQKPVTPGSSAPDVNRPMPWTPPAEGEEAKPAEVNSESMGDVTSEAPTEPVNSSETPSLDTQTPEAPSETAASEAPTTEAMPPAEPPVSPAPPVAPTPPSTPETPLSEAPAPIGVPTPPAPQPPAPSGGSKKWLKIVLLVVVLALVVAAAFFGYKALKHNNQTASVNNALDAAQTKKVSGATDLSTLNSIQLEMPASALASLTKQKTSASTLNYYTTADNTCFVAYGTGDSSIIKGANISEIVNAYLDGIRKTGANVATPTAADPRTFKDTKDATKTYSIPSLNFTFTQGNEHAQGYYSGTVLKSGQRVVVETACDNKTGTVDQAQMTALSNITKQLTITVQ
ncbi:MAG TPA: hypothetical protein VJR27_01230 [Candidatus Saccharimonadales bacterium]|nr:hypothetical protein [Candidatus Saccharimonadales bacterium]